jgi:hypothetical protein
MADRAAAARMSVLRRLIAIAYFVEVGLLLLVVPWTGFMQHNYFVEGWPVLRGIVGNGFVKGAISGLGVINLAAGLTELVNLFMDRRALADEDHSGD